MWWCVLLQRATRTIFPCTHVDPEHARSVAFYRCRYHSCIQPYAHIEPKVRVAKSDVHGYGLFARTDIGEGEVVCMYSGICCDYLEPTNRSDYILAVLWEHPFTFTGEKQVWYLDSTHKDNAAGRYANDVHNTKHETDGPNAYYTDSPLLPHPLAKDKCYVYMRALRDIKKGEEIFVSYGEKYWDPNEVLDVYNYVIGTTAVDKLKL